MRGSTLDIRVWRLWTWSRGGLIKLLWIYVHYDHCNFLFLSAQGLTWDVRISKDGPCAENVKTRITLLQMQDKLNETPVGVLRLIIFVFLELKRC